MFFFGPLRVIGSLAEGVGDVKFVTLVEYCQSIIINIFSSLSGAVVSRLVWLCLTIMYTEIVWGFRLKAYKLAQ